MGLSRAIIARVRSSRLRNVIISFTTVLSLACETTSSQCLEPGPAGERQALPESVMGYTVEVVPRFEGGCGLIKLERDGGRALGHDPSGEAGGCVAPPSEGDPCTFVGASVFFEELAHRAEGRGTELDGWGMVGLCGEGVAPATLAREPVAPFAARVSEPRWDAALIPIQLLAALAAEWDVGSVYLTVPACEPPSDSPHACSERTLR